MLKNTAKKIEFMKTAAAASEIWILHHMWNVVTDYSLRTFFFFLLSVVLHLFSLCLELYFNQ